MSERKPETRSPNPWPQRPTTVPKEVKGGPAPAPRPQPGPPRERTTLPTPPKR